MKLIKTEGRAALYRKEDFYGRANAVVEWVVRFTCEGKEMTACTCSTKREALEWLKTYAA